jgi:hypothetical protein
LLVPSGVRVPSRPTTLAEPAGRALAATGATTGAQRETPLGSLSRNARAGVGVGFGRSGAARSTGVAGTANSGGGAGSRPYA